MKLLVTLCLFASLCVSVLVGRHLPFRCDYTKFEDGWLKLHEIPSNWQEARLRCQMEGATLASPLNDRLVEAMMSLIKNKTMNFAVFTGIHATFSKGDFASIEGIPLSRIPHSWAKNEPDNYNDDESCLVMMRDGKMGDAKCKKPHPYMCYKKKFDYHKSYKHGYEFDDRTGNYYKFHSVPRTWSRAYMTCMAENGYLAIINSEEEATVIRELLEGHPDWSMRGSFEDKNLTLVGFQDWQEHGEWRTIHGETLREAGYAIFSRGEPNNATTGQFCGAVNRDAFLAEVYCERRYSFICEMDEDMFDCDRCTES